MKYLRQSINECITRCIKRALIRNEGNLLKTASDLDIHLKQLYIYRERFPELQNYVKRNRRKGDENQEKRDIMDRRFPDE